METPTPRHGPPGVRRPFSPRRLTISLHRDIGYLVAGLTVIYAISGIAVNHVHHWNPNYRVAREERTFPPLPADTPREAVVAHVAAALGLPAGPKSAFRPAPGRIQIFYEGTTVDADYAGGTATVEGVRERPVLRDVNFLHLNHPKGLWTYVADAYAVLLGTLAITGLFILKGRKGFGGRGKWLFAAGLAVPLLALLLLRWL
jgi:uncharacterized protein